MLGATAKELRCVIWALCFAALIGVALAIEDGSVGTFSAFVGQLAFALVFALATKGRRKAG